MPRIVKLSARLSNLLQFARGDYFKKYAPDSEYNSTKEGRIVRDAASHATPVNHAEPQRYGDKGIPGPKDFPHRRLAATKEAQNTRPAMEAAVRADIKTDLSGKHSAHRAEVAKMEKDHAQRQGYMKQQGMHADAAAEHVAHTKAVVDKERDYADSFLGKKKVEPPVTTGMTTEKQRKRGERIFKKAPHKIISQADQQGALSDRSKFAGSMAEELRTNSNILRSVRKQVDAKDIRAANSKLTKIMPDLKSLVEERVKHETRLDPQRAAALKRKVKAGAASRMASSAGKMGENDNLNRRVHEVTEPLFTPKSIDPERESVTWDREAIAKKIGVKPHVAEKIKTRYAHLAHEQASRASEVRKRVIKEGSAFSPLRSAANASHDYPFLARNARRLKGVGAAAGLAAAGTGALLIRKKKEQPQLQMAARSRIIQLASEPLPVHRVKRIIQGIRRHTVSRLQQEGMIRVPIGKAAMNPPGFNASESEVDALRRRLFSANEAAKNNPIKHSKKLHEVRDRHAEAMEGLKKSHAEERERLIGDVKAVRGNERRIGKRRLIIGSTAAGTAGAVVGHETGKKKEVQFGAADMGRKLYSAITTGHFVTENRLGRLLRKAAPIGSKRRAAVGIVKDWGRGALTGIPGGAEAGAVRGAIGASGRIPSIRNRQIEATMKRIAKARPIQFGVVSITTAKKILRDIRGDRPGLRMARPIGVAQQAAYLSPTATQKTIDSLYVQSGFKRNKNIRKNSVIVPRATKEIKQESTDLRNAMLGGAPTPLHQRNMKLAWGKFDRISDPLGSALHEHGHATMSADADAALKKSRTQAERGIVTAGSHHAVLIGEEYRANREILNRIKLHGSSSDVSKWRRRSQDQIKAGYRFPLFQAALHQEAKSQDWETAMRSGKAPMSLKRRVLKNNPHLRKQEMNSMSPLIRFDAIQSLRNRLRPDDKQSAAHDIITGGIEGGVGVLATDRLIHKFVPSGSGIGRKLAIGAGVGAAATGLIGSAVSRINKKREDMEPVQFASAVARDRYTKGIHENDQAHAESNYLRTGLAGGALASLLAKGPMSKRFLGGAAAGIGIQAATRAYTAGTKDQFGDRSYAGKRIDKAPHEIAGLAAAGIAAKRGLEKWDAAKPAMNRIKSAVGKVGKAGRFFGLASKLQLIQLDEETDRRLERAKRGSYRQAETLYNRAGRAGRLIRDTKTAITGGKNVDSRGRERTPEWKKPWVKKAVGLGITAVGIRHAHNLVKSNKGDIAGAVGRFMRQDASLGHKSGVAVPLSGLQKLARAHPGISRPIIRARREVRGIARDVEDLRGDKKDQIIKRWTGKTPAEAEEAAKATKATNKEAASEEVKRKLRQVRSVNPGQKPPTITEMSARHRVIAFAQTLDDWDISHRSRNTAVIRVPGAQKRDRRQKTYSETAEGQRMLRNVGIGAGATAGVIGTNYIKNRVQAAKETAVDKGWKQSGVTQTGVPLHTSGGPVEDAAAKAAARKARQAATRKIIRQSRRDFRLEIVPNRLIQLNYKLDAILTA